MPLPDAVRAALPTLPGLELDTAGPVVLHLPGGITISVGGGLVRVGWPDEATIVVDLDARVARGRSWIGPKLRVAPGESERMRV